MAESLYVAQFSHNITYRILSEHNKEYKQLIPDHYRLLFPYVCNTDDSCNKRSHLLHFLLKVLNISADFRGGGKSFQYYSW